MLNLFNTESLSFKKISFNRGKSLFVIIPIAIMFGVIVFASSEAKNLIQVTHDTVFSPIQGQNEVIEVNKSSAGFRMADILSSSNDTGYTTTDLSNVSSIENVEKASLVTSLPITRIVSSDLFTDKAITIDKIAGLDTVYAKLYTNENFSYKEGQAIPIILNANDFVEIYQDWQGKTSLTVDFSSGSTPTTALQGPVKARAISYNRSDLIGKTFTISFGGLEDISPYKQTATTSGYTYTKKTDKEIASEIADRKKAIVKYWDYTKVSTPLTYTFVVAGISEGTDKTTAYIPADFATVLMKQYLGISTTAKNKTAIPTADQNVTYTGLVYDGVTLQTDASTTLFAGIRNSVSSQVKSQFNNINKQISATNSKIGTANSQIRDINDRPHFPPGTGTSTGTTRVTTITKVGSLDANNIKFTFPGSTVSYSIPGLVYSKNRTTNALTGVYSKFDFTKSLPLTSTTMLVKLNAIDNRDTVVTALNSKGYNYQDYSKYKEFSKLESYLYLILNIASLVFMAITALFVLSNMIKFVSEGRKEIGIFRAMGATQNDIRSLFIQQSLLYIVLSIVLGAIFGVIAVLATSNIMVQSAQQFVTSTLGSSIVLTNGIASSSFMSLDLQMIGIYTGALIIVTLIVSLIPSGQAAKVSPVEAIRNS